MRELNLAITSIFVIITVLGCAFVLSEMGIIGAKAEVNYQQIQNLQLIAPYEYERIMDIKDRITINITTPDFEGIRLCEWYETRNSSSVDAYQKDIDFDVMQEGQGRQGIIIAHVAIYNLPDTLDTYVVEFAKFTWEAVEVKLDGNVIFSLPEITADGMNLGYGTFRVTWGT